MPITFQQDKLDNGLQIIAETDPAAHTAAIGFFVNTGARDEEPAAMGVSHFLEHMMFKGTERRTADQVDRDFDNLGANHNAFTTSELTAFHAHCLPEYLPQVSDVLADIMRPALRDNDFNDEKNVILEEIAMYEDHPFWVLYERAMEVYYGRHPLAHRVLGTSETITNLKRDVMADYFQTRYAGDNTVIALAGNVDFPQMVDHLRQWCGGWNTSGTKRHYPELNIADGDFTIHSNKVQQQYSLLVSPAPSLQDDQRYAAAILAQILGDQDGSRLYWSLIETGLAEDAQAQYEGRDELGEFYVFFICSPEDGEQVEQVAGEEIDKLIDSLEEDDLLRVRSKTATAVTLHGERPAGRMRRLGQIWSYTGEYRSLESELERINSVTLDDLRAVYEQYPFKPRVVGRLRPGD